MWWWIMLDKKEKLIVYSNPVCTKLAAKTAFLRQIICHISYRDFFLDRLLSVIIR